MWPIYICAAWALIAVPTGVLQCRAAFREGGGDFEPGSVWTSVMLGVGLGFFSPFIFTMFGLQWVFSADRERGLTATLRKQAERSLHSPSAELDEYR